LSKLNKILVFHIGHLGDTLMIVPSLWALRKAFPEASFVLLTDKIAANGFVPAADIFKGADFFENIITFKKSRGGSKLRHFSSMAALWPIIAYRRFDAVAYLVPSARDLGQVSRDMTYFRSAGIKNLIGFKGFERRSEQTGALHESLRILHRLALDGITCNDVSFDLHLGSAEEARVEEWLRDNNMTFGEQTWIAFAPFSKMQVKLWPKERYNLLGKYLIDRYGIIPIILGGADERPQGDYLIEQWHAGRNAAGMPVRETAVLLRKCAAFIGCDSGNMHLAAAMNVPCMAIFSARDEPGKWHPFGDQHIVLRKDIICAGCRRLFCDHQKCLMMITVDEAIAAAEEILKRVK
jgi:heptosyltransferase III